MKKLKDMVFNKNLPFRLLFVVLIIAPILFFWDFAVHIHAHFSGSILPNIITQQWHIVIINIVIFISFLVPLSFRRKVNWKEYGLITAFFVSLFVEMYALLMIL